MYADDIQLYACSLPSDVTSLLSLMGTCITEVKTWMTQNKLMLTEEKTEILLCNTNTTFDNESTNVNHVSVGNEIVSLSEKARNLGVMFDNKLSMKHHVNNMCKSLYLEMRRISQLSNFLDKHSVKILISAFIFSRLDYCNSLLVNLPNDTLNKLQRIQNNAARLVLKKTKREHITPLLRELHWLPVKARIEYKIALYCYKTFNRTAPAYLSALLEQYDPPRSLRSSTKHLLKINTAKRRKLGGRAFATCGPQIWNSLPPELRQQTSEPAFKKHLKTFLFVQHLSS